MLRAALRDLVKTASGLVLANNALERPVRQRIEATGSAGLADYVDRVRQDPDELSALIELLVVPESWLFRDPGAFFAAAEFSRRRFADTGRPVRILCVPCATGEEPYSMAMALLDIGMAPAQFVIDAMDINAAGLVRARLGIFGRNAFRGEDLAFRERYFTSVADGGEALHPDVRKLVKFSQANLLAMNGASHHPPFDVIFCRNLLIYFDQPTQRRAVAILASLLDRHGLLFAGYAELPVFAHNGFVTAQLPGAFALRKAEAANASPAVAPVSAAARVPAPALAATTPTTPAASTATAVARPTSPAGDGVGKGVDVATASEAGALLSRARALADRGQSREAAACLESAIALAPDVAEAHALLGMIRNQEGDRVAAEASLRRALYLDPQHYEAMCQLALLKERGGDGAAAAQLRARAARVFARRQPASAGGNNAGGRP